MAGLLPLGCGGSDSTGGGSGGGGASGGSGGASGSGGTMAGAGGTAGVSGVLPTECKPPLQTSISTGNPLIGIGTLVYVPATGGCAVSGGSASVAPGSVFVFSRVTSTNMSLRLVNASPFGDDWAWVSSSEGNPSGSDEVRIPEDTDVTAVIRNDAEEVELTFTFRVSTQDEVTVSALSTN